MFCVYLTIYRGNKLPPFYIGSGEVKKIENGYRGSVSSMAYKKIFNDELKINPHLFVVKILKTFNTRKKAYTFEERIHRKLNVVKNPLYINKGMANSKHNRGDVSKPVIQLDFENNFIRRYKSITKASEYNNLGVGNIGACTKGKTSQANGFVWVLEENYNKNKDYSLNNRVLYKINESGNIEEKIYTGTGLVSLDGIQTNSKNIDKPEDLHKSQGYFYIYKDVFLNNKDEIKKFILEYDRPRGIYGSCKIYYSFDGNVVKYYNKNRKNLSTYCDKDILYKNVLIFNKVTTIEILKKKWTKLIKNKDRKIHEKIVQLDLEGNYIKTFDSIHETEYACKDSIRANLKNKQFSAHGFIWVFEKDIDSFSLLKPIIKYFVVGFDKNKIIKYKFKNANEASKSLGGDVNAVLRKKQKTSAKCCWVEMNNMNNLYNRDIIGADIDQYREYILR